MYFLVVLKPPRALQIICQSFTRQRSTSCLTLSFSTAVVAACFRALCVVLGG